MVNKPGRERARQGECPVPFLEDNPVLRECHGNREPRLLGTGTRPVMTYGSGLGKCPWLYGTRAWGREEQEVLTHPVEI